MASSNKDKHRGLRFVSVSLVGFVVVASYADDALLQVGLYIASSLNKPSSLLQTE
jgi:hypothetical protein